jgi:hypothetical protein
MPEFLEIAHEFKCLIEVLSEASRFSDSTCEQLDSTFEDKPPSNSNESAFWSCLTQRKADCAPGVIRQRVKTTSTDLKEEGLTMAYLAAEHQVWAARAVGAVAGASVSIIYMLPRGRREAVSRFLTGLVAGLVFGGAAGLTTAAKLGIADLLSPAEIALSGSAMVSLTAWWALGALKRVAERWAR